MASKGARVHIYGDWDGTGVKKAQQDISNFGRQAEGFSGSIKKSFLGIGAAIGGAFAVGAVTDFFGSVMQGAMEDEKAVASLRQTLDNLGQGFQQTGIEKFIGSLQMATGVSDDQLRPAFQRLVTATGDVAKSQDSLKLAMDIAAGTGRDLESVTAALAKGYTGNTTALARLGTGIDANVIKSKDMGAITDALSQKFAGQATTAANTYEGQMRRVTVAVDEAKETIGYSLLGALDKASNAMGGAGGFQAAIGGAANAISYFIDDLGYAADGIRELVGVAKSQKSAAQATEDWTDTFKGMVETLPIVGLHIRVADSAVRAWRSDAIAAERITGALSARYNGLAATAFNAANAIAAANAAAARQATASRYTALAVQEYGKSMSFNGGNLSQWKSDLHAVTNAIDGSAGGGGGGGGGGQAAAVQKLAVVWKQSAASINSDLDGLAINIKGKSETISGGLVDAFQTRLDAFKAIVSEQAGIITNARKALDDYAKSVTDTILGNIKFQTTGVDAEGKTVALTPDQIVQMVLGDINNQTAAVSKIAQIATTIPEALAKQMLTMPPTAAIALADYLANPANSATVLKLNENYQGLATLTQTTLGVPMAAAWAQVGGVSAVSMIDSAKKAIAEGAADFRQWVRGHLATTITVKVNYDTSGAPVGARAAGGPVAAGAPYIVGEKGPELFIPGKSGTIIPNDNLPTASGSYAPMSGNTYAITVQAGVGDPRQIGQQVVEYIKKFEAANGSVFAAA